MSPKFCWAERGFLTGKPKIVSLLRRGCRRDLTQSTAKYLGGRRRDPEQHSFTEAVSDLGNAAAIAEPDNNPVTAEHLIMPKVTEELDWLVWGHPTMVELRGSHVPATGSLGLWQRLSSGKGDGRTGDFSSLLWPGPRDIWKPLGGSAVLAARDPSRAMPSSVGLLLPALGSTQLLLVKLAKHWETRKAMLLPGEHSGQLLTCSISILC